MSFMDRKNILSEGFFGALKKYFKDRKNMSKAEKILLRDPKFRKAYKKWNDQNDKFYSDLEKARKELGLDD